MSCDIYFEFFYIGADLLQLRQTKPSAWAVEYRIACHHDYAYCQRRGVYSSRIVR